MLTETQVRNAKPTARPRKLYDSRGLYLQVMPHGGRWWRFMLLAGTAAAALLRSDLRPGDRVAPRTRGALSRAWLPLPTVNAGTVRPRGS